jgi:hypothetical protein
MKLRFSPLIHRIQSTIVTLLNGRHKISQLHFQEMHEEGVAEDAGDMDTTLRGPGLERYSELVAILM